VARARQVLVAVLLAYGAIALCHTQEVPADVLTAKTVFVTARVGSEGAGKYSPDAKRAKQQAEKLLRHWGRYQLVDAQRKADLVILIIEGEINTYDWVYGRGISFESAQTLTDTLMVYKAASFDEAKGPLWKRTESGDDWDWPAERVIKKFRKAVEKASK